jgi:hypothetical protein
VLRLLGFHNFYQLASTTLRQQHELGLLIDFDQTAWLRASRGMRAQRTRGDRTAWLGMSDSNSGICVRAMYLRYRDNSCWLGQKSPAETIRV